MLASRLVDLTESILTWRKRRKLRRKIKHRHLLVSWLMDFLWAAMVVLAINQYFLQAYRIPSGSMRPTLLVMDRLFVNKLIYGPELIPGAFKISGFATPKRGEIIIFENPSYIERGPVFSFFHRLIYMLTLSLVDIDRDERGMPRAQLLIKRMLGSPGDLLSYRNGTFMFKLSGTEEWISEADMQKLTGLSYPVQRLVDSPEPSTTLAALQAKESLGITLTREEANLLERYVGTPPDVFAYELARIRTFYEFFPDRPEYARRYRMISGGWYVPENHLLPLGDNRDNSRDGRYFGPVSFQNVLGHASLIYWPLERFSRFTYNDIQ